MIKKYAIARCSLGVYGIITVDAPQPVQYADGNKGEAWTGFVIRGTIIAGIGGHVGKTIHVKAGDLWSSKRPVFVAQLHCVEHLSQADLIEFARRTINAMGK